MSQGFIYVEQTERHSGGKQAKTRRRDYINLSTISSQDTVTVDCLAFSMSTAIVSRLLYYHRIAINIACV